MGFHPNNIYNNNKQQLTMNDYFYTIGKAWQSFDSLEEARKEMKSVIKNDMHTALLNRDNEGRYYILRRHINKENTRRFYL